jgi:DNA-damage-inducible protein J
MVKYQYKINCNERNGFMAQINLRIDDEVKRNAEQICAEIGMSMSTAITVFLKKVAREKRIPFELSVDPFYSESNMKHLEKVISDIEVGRAKLVEHDITEVD